MTSFKSSLTRILPRSLINLLSTLKFIFRGDYLALRRRLAENEHDAQMLALYLLRQQPTLTTHMRQVSALQQHELSIYSQNGEDGILLFIFGVIGTVNRRFVEFGIGNGKQCNTANLSLNFGWSGLLMEVDSQNVIAAQQFYQQKLGPEHTAVQIICAQVTAENINTLLSNQHVTGEIDLLSIDIDGNDYWVWQAITVIQPRVVVVEYNPTFGKEASITVPYDPDFERFARHPSGFYHGASLSALAKLGQNKGYILVGSDSSGANAFFVRQDVASGRIDSITAAEAFFPSYYRSVNLSQDEQFALIAKMPFEKV
ncbi:MAG: FkbM family methyltransferase [Anaerolineae bacterium]|nr:FkbM family methyltransferase [Anaerolineae bacterium]